MIRKAGCLSTWTEYCNTTTSLIANQKERFLWQPFTTKDASDVREDKLLLLLVLLFLFHVICRLGQFSLQTDQPTL
jgi:hypothetical protein